MKLAEVVLPILAYTGTASSCITLFFPDRTDSTTTTTTTTVSTTTTTASSSTSGSLKNETGPKYFCSGFFFCLEKLLQTFEE